MLFLTSFKCLLVLFLVWWISLYLCLLSYSFVPSHISSSVFAYPFCTFSVIFISVIYLNYHTLLLQCNIIIHNTFILLQGNLATQAEIHTSAQSSSKMSLPLSSTSGIWNAPTVNTFLFFFFSWSLLALFKSHLILNPSLLYTGLFSLPVQERQIICFVVAFRPAHSISLFCSRCCCSV